MIEGSAWCEVCGQQRAFIRRRVNHLLHLFLTVFTFGLWAFVWLAISWGNLWRLPRCHVCGARLSKLD